MLATIRSVIGIDAMMCLAATRGGEVIYIPAHVPSDHWLIQTIGQEAAAQLAAHFSIPGRKNVGRGTRLELPLLPKEFRIRDLINEGRSLNEIARQLGISQRTVVNYRRWIREAEGC